MPNAYYQDELLDEMEAINLSSTLKNEWNDCAVKAIALATGKGYDEIHKLLKKMGRRDRGTTQRDVIYCALQRLGAGVKGTPKPAKTILTLERTLTKKRDLKTYLVETDGHILCVKGGIPLDWTRGRRNRIRKMFEVVLDTDPVPW